MTKPKLTLAQKGDLGPKAVRAVNWQPRIKHKNEVTGPDATSHWGKRPAYVVGDGDHNVYIPREGSCHKHLLSFGDRT